MKCVEVQPAIFWECGCGQGNFLRPVESGEVVETTQASFGYAVPSHDIDDNRFVADEAGRYVMVIPSKVQCGACKGWRLVELSEGVDLSEGDAEGEDDAE